MSIGDRRGAAAILRRFEVMGEAATHVSAAFREAHPEVPWKRIIAFRNVLIHAYDRIEMEPVVAAIESLPDLITALKKQALEELPDMEAKLKKTLAGRNSYPFAQASNPSHSDFGGGVARGSSMST